MPDDKNTFSEKVKILAERLSASKSASRVADLTAREWEIFLQEASSEQLDDAFHILDEEVEMKNEIKKEAERKKYVNKTRLLQRREKLVLEAEEYERGVAGGDAYPKEFNQN